MGLLNKIHRYGSFSAESHKQTNVFDGHDRVMKDGVPQTCFVQIFDYSQYVCEVSPGSNKRLIPAFNQLNTVC